MLSVSMTYCTSVLNMLLAINPLIVAVAVPGIAPVESYSKNVPPSNDFRRSLSPPRPPPDAASYSGGNGLPRNVIEDIVITTSTSSSYLRPDNIRSE